MSIASLQRHLERIQQLQSRLQKDNTPITFVTYWGNEEIPDGEGVVIKTEWGMNRLEGKDTDEQD